MSKRLPYAEARERAIAVLDTPRDTPISPDFFPGTRTALMTILVREGRSGMYGEHFEDLTDPLALHVPGATTRTDRAVMDAITDLGMHVIPDHGHNRHPLFGVGGDYAASGLVDLRGVLLVLLTAYNNRGHVPDELTFAAQRVTTSGTHAVGVAHRITDHLRKNARDAQKRTR